MVWKRGRGQGRQKASFPTASCKGIVRICDGRLRVFRKPQHHRLRKLGKIIMLIFRKHLDNNPNEYNFLAIYLRLLPQVS